MTAPLEGLRVLDLSRVLAGPWAAQTLADLGAEIIKIERPGTGDDTRAWGPPYALDAAGKPTSESAYYLSTNRGKKSVTVDIATAAGQDIIRRLAKVSDIVIENYKVGSLAKYGLDYAALAALNPRLVYCSISGFGQTGPLRDLPGYDFMIQGLGGLMSITGQPDGVPGGGPVKTGVALVDILTALYATTGILAAINRRHVTGRGDYIDIALLDVQVATLANQAMNYLATGRSPVRLGNAHPNIVPYETFPTADGHMILAVGNDSQFASFCRIAGRPDLAEDPHYKTNRARVENRAVLIPLLGDLIRLRSTADWCDGLAAANVPAGPINTLEQVFENEQVKARGMRLDLDHPTAGSVPSVASPIRYAEAPVDMRRPPPLLGQHTEQVLSELLGLPESGIQSLRTSGVI